MRRAPQGRAWLFVAPALAVYALFALLPILEALGLSLFRWEAGDRLPAWRGLANYAEALGDADFWTAVLNNLLLAALSAAVQIPLALLLAVLVAGRVRGRWLFRTAYFAPMVLPTAVVAIFWMYVLDAHDGLARPVLGLLGQAGRDPLGGGALSFLAVFAAISWRYVGFHMVILLAGVLAVPEELYEAAALDGASWWGRFRHVTLPGVRGALAISVLLSVVGSIKYFDLVFIMGRPFDLGATWIYQVGIAGGRTGYGCALAGLLLALSMIAALALLAVRRRREARG